MKWLRVVPVFAVVLAAGGCKPKIHVNRTYDIDGGNSQMIGMDPQTGEVKVKVEFSSTAGPVTVMVVADDMVKGKMEEIEPSKVPADAILGKEKAKDGTVTATVPAKKAFSVFIFTEMKTTVKVKIDTL